MSYSFSLQVRQGASSADVCSAVEEKGLDTLRMLSDPVHPEMDAHIRAAAKAVEFVVQSGALGQGARVNVSISGHAEPSHVKRDGWSQDTMSISLSQVQEPYQPAADKALGRSMAADLRTP